MGNDAGQPEDRRGSTPAQEPAEDTRLKSSVAALLGRWGVSASSTRTGVEETARCLLAEKGLMVEVQSLRWKTLTLVTSAPTAVLVQFEKDRLMEALADAHPGAVAHVVVHIDAAG